VKITVSVPGNKPSLQLLAVEALVCAAVIDAPPMADKTSEYFMINSSNPKGALRATQNSGVREAFYLYGEGGSRST